MNGSRFIPRDRAAAAVTIRGLRRVYGTGRTAFEAVCGIDLDVPAGSITALLGTNGAGKTSTLELVEGLARPSGGAVRVLGLDPVADRGRVRRRTGVLLQRSGFSGDLTVVETLRMWAATLSHPASVATVVDELHLTDRAGIKVSALSGGEQRRLDLACALMGSPELLVLDEPTTGLDPESRRAVWSVVRDRRQRGATVLFSTHYLEEAESLADSVAIMHAGRLVRRGAPAEIVEDHPSVIRFREPEAGPDLPALPGRIRREGAETVLETGDLQSALTALLAWAHDERVRLEQLSATPASLEAVFLDLADRPYVESGRPEPVPVATNAAPPGPWWRRLS